MGTRFHSATRALVKSGTDVGRLGLARSRYSNYSQRYSIGLKSGLCAGQASSSTKISTNHFCMDLALCMEALSCWSRKGSYPNCCHKLRGLTQTMKNVPRPFLIHQTLQLALYFLAGSVFLASAKPRLLDGDAWFITPENAFILLQSPMALHHSSWRLALHMHLGLCAAPRPWKPISWSSWQTVLVLTLLPEAVLELGDECFNRGACLAYHFAAEPLLLLDVSASQ